MKVYILTIEEEGDFVQVGIYATEELAKKKWEEIKDQWLVKYPWRERWYDKWYHIEGFEVIEEAEQK